MIELVLPPAYMVQIPTWDGEDPRCLRALLAQAPFETVSAIATHFLGRPATPPLAGTRPRRLPPKRPPQATSQARVSGRSIP